MQGGNYCWKYLLKNYNQGSPNHSIMFEKMIISPVQGEAILQHPSHPAKEYFRLALFTLGDLIFLFRLREARWLWAGSQKEGLKKFRGSNILFWATVRSVKPDSLNPLVEKSGARFSCKRRGLISYLPFRRERGLFFKRIREKRRGSPSFMAGHCADAGKHFKNHPSDVGFQ